jgi:response regulator of citrate/malate metabolism
MKNKVKISQRGRPPVNIQWPDVVFTAQDVVDTQPVRVSRVTIHSKLNLAVDQGDLKVVGKIKTKNGRPRVTYEKCEALLPTEEAQPLCQG